MAITKVSNSGFKTGVLKYDSFLAGNSTYYPPAMDSIATTSLSSAQTGVTFSSISSAYTHLQIRYIMRANTDTAVRMRLRFNGDTGSNYAVHLLEGDGSAAASFAGASTTLTLASPVTRSSYLANTFVAGVIDILDYKDTNKYKTVRMLAGQDLNGVNGMTGFSSGVWMNTSAATSVTLLLDSSIAFAPNSHFALYGIASA